MSEALLAGRDRPLSILIAALGGEGGGLLADWIVEAATGAGVLVQSTSIPGVAQRTGATTYYIEMMRLPPGETRDPVFGLYPAPGHVDLMVASELVEAGRALENGFVTPDRTTLIAATHRVFAMEEKISMGDGAFEAGRVLRAADELAKVAMLRDFRALSLEHNAALNALLLGAIAASGLCPIPDDTFEAAISARGVAVKSNLAAFRLGAAFARGQVSAPAPRSQLPDPAAASGGLAGRLAGLPGEVVAVARAGVERMIDYQDEAYANLYLDRLDRVVASERLAGGDGSFAVSRETARWLALWMAYEDVMRVADLKSRASRYARIRSETAARTHEPVRTVEFLKPGIDEIATVLPRAWGEKLTQWADRRGIKDRLHMPLHVRSDTVVGYLRLRLLAALRRRRRSGLRFAQEQAMIERWHEAVLRALPLDAGLAREVADCGRLIKGYSDTRERAMRNFNAIFGGLVAPALAGTLAPQSAAAQIAAARQAALSDEDGKALARLLADYAAIVPPTDETAVQAAR